MAKTVSFRNQKLSFYGAVFQISFNQERVKNQKTVIKHITETKITTNKRTKTTKQQHCICKLKVVQVIGDRHVPHSRVYISTFNTYLFCIIIIQIMRYVWQSQTKIICNIPTLDYASWFFHSLFSSESCKKTIKISIKSIKIRILRKREDFEIFLFF